MGKPQIRLKYFSYHYSVDTEVCWPGCQSNTLQIKFHILRQNISFATVFRGGFFPTSNMIILLWLLLIEAEHQTPFNLNFQIYNNHKTYPTVLFKSHKTTISIAIHYSIRSKEISTSVLSFIMVFLNKLSHLQMAP